MLLTLERQGLISRRPGVPRSVAVLLDRSALPDLEPGYGQSVKITVQRYYYTSPQIRTRFGPFQATSGFPFMVQRNGFAIVALK